MNNLNLGQELDQIALNHLIHELDQKMHWNTTSILKGWESQLKKKALTGVIVINLSLNISYTQWTKYGIDGFGNISIFDYKLKNMVNLWVKVNGLTRAKRRDYPSTKLQKFTSKSTMYDFAKEDFDQAGQYTLSFDIKLGIDEVFTTL